jgi:membrane protein DedA with SNARE-associated domain
MLTCLAASLGRRLARVKFAGKIAAARYIHGLGTGAGRARVPQDCIMGSEVHQLLDHLIATYGYYALLVGTCLEGETIMVLAGIAARQGLLHLPWVIVLGFLGSLTGDQTIFFLSRWKGKWLLSRFPSWHPRIVKISRILERHGTWYILTFRFYYGLRNISPLVIGVSSVPTAKFVVLNVTGAIVWAITLGCLGYAFGVAVERVLSNLKIVILAVAGLAVLLWLIRQVYRWRSARRVAAEEAARAQEQAPK